MKNMNLDNLFVIVQNEYGKDVPIYVVLKSDEVFTMDEIKSMKISFDEHSDSQWIAQSLSTWGDEMRKLGRECIS